MSAKHRTPLYAAVIIVASIFVFILYGNKGLSDLKEMKQGLHTLIRSNQTLIRKNIDLYQAISRLKYDFDFIENIARQDLGLVSENEIVYKFVSAKTTATASPGVEQ